MEAKLALWFGTIVVNSDQEERKKMNKWYEYSMSMVRVWYGMNGKDILNLVQQIE